VVKLRVVFVSAISATAFWVALPCLASGQNVPSDSIVWFHPNQEVRVRDLPSLTAPSTDSSAVLATALETILHDKAVCCGKDSALEDVALSDPASLKDLSTGLQGRHFLNSGQAITFHAEYIPPGSIDPGIIIGALLEQHAPLIEWKDHYYVVYGAIVNETLYYSGRRQYVILKFLLLDPRFSDQRRESVFSRETDNWGKVQGVLTMSMVRQ
jgi:hypothetical protein